MFILIACLKNQWINILLITRYAFLTVEFLAWIQDSGFQENPYQEQDWASRPRLRKSHIETYRDNEKSSRWAVISGMRPLVLGQDRSETQKSVCKTKTKVLVLQVWCCVMKLVDLVTLVIIMWCKAFDNVSHHRLFVQTVCLQHTWQTSVMAY